MKNLIIFCALLLSSAAILAQDANLKLNLEKNKTYRLKTVSHQNTSQTINGMEQTTSSQTNTVFSIKMVDAGADFFVAEVRFDTIITNTNAMGKLSNISSAVAGNIASEETEDVMSYIMNLLSKNALYVKMDATGKVIDIINHSMLSAIVLKDTASIKGAMAPMLKTQIKNTVSRGSLNAMIEAFTFGLPGKVVKKGDEWDLTMPIEAGGMSLEIITHYKLESLNDKDAAITAESMVKPAANAKPMEYSGARITYDGLNGMGKSEMTMNTLTGLVMESTAKTNITGDLGVSAQGMNMQIPMKIESTSTTTFVK